MWLMVNVLHITRECVVGHPPQKRMSRTNSVEPRWNGWLLYGVLGETVARMGNQHEELQHGTKRELSSACYLAVCYVPLINAKGYDWGGKVSSREGIESDNTHQWTYIGHASPPFSITLRLPPTTTTQGCIPEFTEMYTAIPHASRPKLEA